MIELSRDDATAILSALGMMKRDLERSGQPRRAARIREDMERLLTAAEASGHGYLRDTFAWYMDDDSSILR